MINLTRFEGVLLLAFCQVFPTTSYADIREIEVANNQLAVQIASTYMDYTETINDAETGAQSPLDTEAGFIPGYGATVSVMRDGWLEHEYLALEYSKYSGTVKYVGGSWSNPTYGSNVGTSGMETGDYSLRLGKGLVVDSELMVTLYGEYGRHKWNRLLGYGTPYGYQEKYTHSYYGIGALGQLAGDDHRVWSAYVLAGRTASSRIEVFLPPPWVGFTAGLGNSELYKAGLSVDRRLSENIHLSLGIDYANWKYGASQIYPAGAGLYLYEPDSATNLGIARMGIGYAF